MPADRPPTSSKATELQNREDPCETPRVADDKEDAKKKKVKAQARLEAEETDSKEDISDDTSDEDDDGDDSDDSDDEEDADDSEPRAGNEKERAVVARDVAVASPRTKRAKRSADPPPAQAAIPLAPIAHFLFVVAAAIGVYSFVSVAKEGEMRRRCTPTCILHPNYAGYEKKAPSFTLKDTKGHDVSLESYKGKVVVLNFWTKTCGPCMEEMPEIADLARILKPIDDVAVLTISTDDTAQEAIDTLKSVLRDEPPFPVLMDPDAKIVKGKFGTSLYPETWIIDKSGVIRARFDGAREWSNATVVELVNQIRGGSYCPVQARDGKFVGDAVRVCEGLTGG